MDPNGAVLQIQVEDYVLARNEVVAAIDNQHKTLTFGTAALVAAFGAGFLSWDNTITPAVFLSIVPLSWWILTMWLGEVVRMLRAVQFSTAQEKIIAEAVGSIDPDAAAPLRWEQWRQDPGTPERTISWTYESVGVLILVTNIAALTCWTITAIDSKMSTVLIALIWLLVSAAGLAFVRWVGRTYTTWSGDLGEKPSGFRRLFSDGRADRS